jgi:hypothetical protein
MPLPLDVASNCVIPIAVMPGETITQGGEESEPVQALLLTGEGVRTMSVEGREMLRRMFDGLGIQIAELADRSEVPYDLVEVGEGEEEPVLTDKKGFRAFATSHGYTDARACRSWVSVVETRNTARAGKELDGIVDRYPIPQFTGNSLDLRSVAARLAASDMRPEAWKNGTKGNVGFLTHIVKERVLGSGDQDTVSP